MTTKELLENADKISKDYNNPKLDAEILNLRLVKESIIFRRIHEWWEIEELTTELRNKVLELLN